MDKRIGYVISSTKNYYGITLPRFIKSIPKDKKKDFTVVVNGYDWRGVETFEDGLTFDYVEDNSFEYSALIEVVNRYESFCEYTHIFLGMDTAELGPKFFELVERFDASMDAVAVYGGECNLGVYSVKYLYSKRDYLRSLLNCNKTREVEEEGKLYRMCERKAHYVNATQTILGYEDVYGNGVMRAKTRYDAIDYIKWKANWGQTSVGERWIIRP